MEDFYEKTQAYQPYVELFHNRMPCNELCESAGELHGFRSIFNQAMNFRKKQQFESAGFQMAPMIDIIFILLIHFMAATIFAQWEQKMDITVPTADSSVTTARQPGEVIINIDENGIFFINSREISDDLLYTLLSQISSTFKTQPIIIRADENTPHKHVIRALDLCRKADIWNIAFSCIKHESSPTAE